ncbi:DHA2 family efflux MFS transporter permease subunit [Paraburkholderia sp. BCC1886]|uniref:DHA2 family efflux MFS transporter permease subunit n=1 Tax=Paraburkholderia sp. BCC1886 TaxID=2562670 RepID=UPI001184670E|nr:DHA2 family efflux MFS transporter permease subunit [Paraburkholderia sp. BCC1886]
MSATHASLPRSAAGPYNPWLIAVIVSIATFMEVLDTTIANVALRHIAGGLGASQDQSTYITTSYLVSNAIVLPISGWLANVVGRKRFYMICVFIFTISSVACGFATSLPMMILFRVLQGLGGGGLAPVEQSIFADTFTPEKRAMAFALYGLTVVTAPAIGPMLGGWITENYSWHWVFLINFPVGLLSLVLTGLFVSDSKLVKEERRTLLAKGLRIDYFGFVLVAVGFGCLQIVLDKFEREDGFSSPFICWLAGISAVSLLILVFWELWVEQPIVNLRLFKSSAFAISCTVMFAFGFIINSTTQILPQFTQALLGYDATNAGLTLGLGGLVTLFFMPIAGIVTGRVFQPKWLVLMSLAGTGIALFHASGLNLNIGFWDVSLSRLYQVIWLPFLFIPLSAVQFVGIPPKENNNASALINMMRNLGGSFGVSLVTTELAQREQFHHARLAEHITPYNGFVTSLGSIASTVEQQASVMSYLDVFIMLGCIALVLCPICIFLPKLTKGAQINAH